MRVRLDPTLLHENGNTATFVPFVAGGSGEGYWKTESGARWKYTTSATMVTVRIAATGNPAFYSAFVFPTLIAYRVNGTDYWASQARTGDGTYKLYLGPGQSKMLELFVPVAYVPSFGQPVLGTFPMDIDFGDDVPTVVTPTNSSPHRVIYSDSIGSGFDAMVSVLQGYAGTMKRGYSDPFLPPYRGTYSAGTIYVPGDGVTYSGSRYIKISGGPAGVTPTVGANWQALPSRWVSWAGVYDAGTTYGINDVVSYSGSTWLKLTTAAAGTTPAVGSDWQIRGYLGRVTVVAHSARRLLDDCFNSGLQTAFAAFIASLNPTELITFIGINDYTAGWSAANFQTGYTGFLNALAGTSASGCTVRCFSPLITSALEGVANSFSNTPDDYRTAVSNAAAATTKTGVSFVNGKTILTTGDLQDGIHPSTAGHMKLRQAML